MNFKNSPQIQQKGSSPYLSRQSSNSSFKAKTQKNVEPPSPLTVGCCRGLNSVKTTGSSASTTQQNLKYQSLELKVADLEKEVEKQKELRVMYRKRMERTQDYLRYCLQIAQENGILDLLSATKIELEEKIGEGSTAEIHRGTWRGYEVVVKCISKNFFRKNENGVAYFSQELEILSRQRHRLVLQLMGACIDPPYRAWVVTE